MHLYLLAIYKRRVCYMYGYVCILVMYASVCVFVYAYMCAFVCMYVCACVWMHVFVSMCLYYICAQFVFVNL